MTLFLLLSAASGLWQLGDGLNKVRAVEWIHQVTLLGDQAQRASAQTAIERGITATLLADPAQGSADMRAQMQRVRAAVDESYVQIMAHAGELSRHDPEHVLFSGLETLQQSRALITRAREQVDEQLLGRPNALDASHWIALTTTHIEELQNLAVIGLPLPDSDIYGVTYRPLLSDILFTLSEYSGRQRAALGVVIAQQRPLDELERQRLEDYRVVAQRAQRRAEAILSHQRMTPALEDARQSFLNDFVGRYEPLRAAVHASSVAGQAYPVTTEQWYREASAGIDAVLAMSAAVSSEFNRDVMRLRAHAVNTMWLLGLVFCVLMALFVTAIVLLGGRVLRPLQQLEEAALTIAHGDLSQPLEPLADDEFGRLGRAFEQMRQTLLADIDRREEDATALRKFRTLIEQSTSAMIVTDVSGKIEYVNEKFTAMTGYGREEAVGNQAGFWRSGLTSPDQYKALWASVSQGKAWQGEVVNRRKSGEQYCASVSVSPVCDERGVITHLIGIQNDISEHRRIEEQLAYLSRFDELTRLPNRVLLEERFVQASNDGRGRGPSIGVVTLGVSGFKRVNDTRGRDVGDRILQEIAWRLAECSRGSDTVSRHSGTEFTLMMPQFGSIDELMARLADVLEIVNRPMLIDGEKIQLNVKAGVSTSPRDGSQLEALLSKAAIALHHAERQGMGCCLYTEPLGLDMHERLELENALRLSLERGSLEVHYQPKVDLTAGRLVGVEALARWRHPLSEQYISPQRFIAIAEEYNLIAPLGAWVLREACRQNKAWLDAGLPRIVVAVNVSPVQLRHASFVDLVASILADTGLDPSQLELELTESALMDNPDQANEVLGRLKTLGLTLAIDDFGTGYSSLAYLSRFPVDVLKIDRCFVKDVTSDATSAAISTSVIALAHQLGLKVIAEGVETEAQLAFLSRNRCDEGQGYYFGKPVPSGTMLDLLARNESFVLPRSGDGKRTVLIVDEDRAVLAALSELLEGDSVRVLVAQSGREALELLASNEVQVTMWDERMPEMAGGDFFRRIGVQYPDVVRMTLAADRRAESSSELTTESTTEPTTEPTTESTTEPTTEPTIEPTTESITEPPLKGARPAVIKSSSLTSWTAPELRAEVLKAFDQHAKRNRRRRADDGS